MALARNTFQHHPVVTASCKDVAARLRLTAKSNYTSDLPLQQWALKYLPHHFSLGMSLFHDTIAKEYDSLTFSRGKRLGVIAPRGNAKSTWTLAKALKSVCEKSEHYIFLISDTGKQAQKILEDLKSELEHNLILAKDYPNACVAGQVWNADRIETFNGVCVEALGTGQKVRGRKYRQYRPSLIILDDPDNDEDVRSPTIRQQHIEWFSRALLECGDPNTNIIVVGTMIHRECLVGYVEKRVDFKIIKFQSILMWPTNMDLWNKWEILYLSAMTIGRTENGVISARTGPADDFYLANAKAMNEGAKVLWPEREDLYFLMKKRATSGHASFQSEKQNDPRDPSKCEFREEWLDGTSYEVEELNRLMAEKDCVSVVYGDPAKGVETKKHDYSAVVALHYFGSENVYVECSLKRIPTTEFTDELCLWQEKVKPQAIGIEDQGFQELIGEELYTKARQRNLFDMNVVSLPNGGINKKVRISRLSIWLERKFFKFRSNCSMTSLLLQQILDHPFSDHDDGPDALEGAMRLLQEIMGNQVTRIEDGLPQRIS